MDRRAGGTAIFDDGGGVGEIRAYVTCTVQGIKVYCPN